MTSDINDTKNVTVVGLTGSIGSGKSAVAAHLVALGAKRIDADLLAREVVAKDSAGLTALAKHFGQSILLADGTLNRPALGAIIFNDRGQRTALEDILHPLIRTLFLDRLAVLRGAAGADWTMIVYDVPLLFESRFEYEELDVVVTVSASDEQCIERIMQRENCSRETATARLKTQLPLSYKEDRAHYLISNRSTLERLKDESARFYEWCKGLRACSVP